jgi:cellulose synthase/poly-beta-1,6-N-acetylglucosamine synthase-like glycosyltransferase
VHDRGNQMFCRVSQVLGVHAIATAVLVAITLTACCRTFMVLLAARWLSRPSLTVSDTGPLPPIVVLLPAYMEQKLVEATLRHFAQLDYPTDRYRIVVVTTQRERTIHSDYSDQSPDGGAQVTGHQPHKKPALSLTISDLPSRLSRRLRRGSKTTLPVSGTVITSTGQLVDAVLAQYSIVKRIDAPASWRFKAGQLRYAIQNLETILEDWPLLKECRYVGIYDFDARPDRYALRAAAAAAKDRPPIMQQPGFTVPRASVSGSAANRLFSLLDGQLHARYGLRVELASLILDRLVDRLGRNVRVFFRSSIHTVGIGLFLDRQQLDEIGGIPPIVDDLAIGWRAAGAGLAVAPIKSPVFYDAYGSLRQAARSRAFICSGYLRATEDIRAAPGRVPSTLPIHLARIYYRLFQTAWGPYARLALLLITLWFLPVPTLAIAALAYVLFLFDLLAVRGLWRRWQPVPRTIRVNLIALIAGPIALSWYGRGIRISILRRWFKRPAGM